MGKVKEPAAIIGEGITEKYYIESLKDLRELSPKPKFLRQLMLQQRNTRTK